MSGDPALLLMRGGAGLPAPGDAAWDRLAAAWAAESLSGLALTLLEKAGRLDHVPATALRKLERDRNAVRASQTILFDRFASLAGTLHDAGVPFIVHKGGVLAELVYERAEDRPMSDIDVIFRPHQWETVRDALRSAGYRLPEGARESFWLENYFNINAISPVPPVAHFDMHWGLTQEGRYHVETSELFDRALPYHSRLAGGQEVLRLSDEDLLLSLFLHLAYHYFEARIQWLYDMKRVIERLPPDWDLLGRRARAWGLDTVLALNLDYLEKLFPGVVPPEVARAHRIGPVRSLVLGPFRSSDSRRLFRGWVRRLVQFTLGLAAIDRPRDMAGFAAGKTFRSLRWAGKDPHHH